DVGRSNRVARIQGTELCGGNGTAPVSFLDRKQTRAERLPCQSGCSGAYCFLIFCAKGHRFVDLVALFSDRESPQERSQTGDKDTQKDIAFETARSRPVTE